MSELSVTGGRDLHTVRFPVAAPPTTGERLRQDHVNAVGVAFDERYDASTVIRYAPGQLDSEPAWRADVYEDDPRPGHRAPDGHVDPYGGTLYDHMGTPGFRIQPPAADFTSRIWQGVFSGDGAAYAAAGGSNLLLNRAAYGFDAPTDEVQRPWADAYLAAWSQPHRPRIGLSRFVFPAKDRRTALQQIGDDVHAAALRTAESGAFPKGLDRDEALRRFHSFYGHPDDIVAALQRERVLPVATDLITQFNPAIPDHDAAIRALELIATEVAPALGWKPATKPEPAGA